MGHGGLNNPHLKAIFPRGHYDAYETAFRGHHVANASAAVEGRGGDSDACEKQDFSHEEDLVERRI
jgi:hypothetical protein